MELREPRSLAGVLSTALSLLRRYPLLFGVLALAVVAPYELLVLVATGAAPLGQQNLTVQTAFVLFLLDLALVGPLVSALHVHAVVAVSRGERPEVLKVARLGMRTLPVVAAAQIVASLGIGIGLLAFVVPGVILALRWAVVAQCAAVEGADWLGALRRSGALGQGSSLHILGLLAVTALVSLVLNRGGEAIAGTGARPLPIVLGIVVATVVRSFSALTSAVLYFDLLARRSQTPR